MSIRRWLRTTDNPLPLPKAGDSGVVAANKEVAAVAAAQGEKRKRGPYHRYSDKLRAKIAKYACENGNKSAVEKFSTQLGYSISGSKQIVKINGRYLVSWAKNVKYIGR